MTNQHPITPPPELVRQWHVEAMTGFRTNGIYEQDIATLAAQWGADQELEAMLAELKALHLPDGYAARLRAARRSKPPSLKEQAQVELDRLVALISTEGALAMAEPIRRALEALPE
jgi:hypothetical protein